MSMGFSRQEYWSGLPCLPAGDLPNLGIKTESLTSPALAAGFLTTSASWENWRCSIQPEKTRPGGDSDSDYEPILKKIKLELNKVGKTTRFFRYDLIKSLMNIQWR